MDELTLIRRFRADVDAADEPARARARGLLLATIATASKAPGKRPPSLPLGRPGRFVLIAAAFAVVGAGIAAAAANHWLVGDPAPQAVVSGFDSYTTQLGFHPEPGRAVLVARDDDLWLYATTNKEGTYCVLLSAPWMRPEKLTDGGSCLPAEEADVPLAAWNPGISSQGEDGKSRFVYAGRTTHAEARTIRITTPAGEAVERPIGSSGFFVLGVRLGFTCALADSTWNPVVRVLDSDGDEVASKTLGFPSIVVAQRGSVHVCGAHRAGRD
jgi:hypothetical protein